MKFRVENKINDGMAEAPAVEVEARTLEDLFRQLLGLDSLANDYGEPYGVGATLVIERVE